MPKKKKNNKLRKFIPTTPSEKILTIAFIVLLITVVVLFFVAMNKKHEVAKKHAADIVVPIVEKGTNNTINIDISNLKATALKDYSFRVTNYKDKTVNSSSAIYNIEFDTNDNDVTLKLYKNNKDENLFKDASTYELKDIKLSQKEEQEDTYTLIIKANKEIKDKQSIKVKISGQQIDN